MNGATAPLLIIMLLKTITNSRIADELIAQILKDPKGFVIMMNISFLINIIMFILSILSVVYLCIIGPNNPLFYFVPSVLFVFYFKTIFSYREYFVVFIESFIFQFDVLTKTQTMSEEEKEVFFSGIHEDITKKFMSYKRGE